MKNVVAVNLAFLLAVSPLAALAGDSGRVLSAELFGDQEVPGPGDPDGFGEAVMTVNPGQRELCFQLSVTDIAPATAAHIHRAPAGVAGGIVVGLTAPTSGFSSDCISVDRDLLRELIQTPLEFYVNVHNADFPGGAVREQLDKGERDD